VILRGYIDESADDVVFVLAGFVAPAEEWAKFSDSWEAALRMTPRISILKTNDAMRLNGEFRGWTEETRDEKLRLLYSVIDDHVSFGVSSVVPIEPLKRIFGTGIFAKAAVNPYYHALPNLISDVARHQIKIGMKEKIDFVFDERVMEQGKILSIWTRLFEDAPSDVKPMLGGTPAFKRDDDVLPLQAGDLEAWWLRRRWLEKLKGLPRLEYPWVPSAIPELSCVHTEETLFRKMFWMRGEASARFGPWW
jgi:hypothetical protein